ncbi:MULTISPECIES: GGDEF domain-containing protein [unclassified Chelatococcus]|uniref:GGDEF domain-containing protein n=1 Tax=unclassified Chelatococcus TaxID=2638111 RepID=UPI001BCE0A00|nr:MULTISPECIES: GGDEF domain-containing protein [unclassified Chelatococcus]CAH1653489.1 putative diguanylate cyclase YeaP [Hyphomicrobiales bacterium]MBS7742895.1 diguanylate cyclase [Chelatococcus sp. HY11]MBX3541987.1 diguanylate cyclase [Chelatococcus sp.]MCO5074121.1 diguanylate cyclase [Chelatococcus sp.]CAH1694451.1 putative diguanylate cyclase YeaP [Hyphomicrobiales bacterium]
MTLFSGDGATGVDSVSGAQNQESPRGQKTPPIVRRVTLGVVVAWLALVGCLGWWLSQRIMADELNSLAASAEHEATTTARVMDRLFTEMVSVANMVASQNQVIELATRYRLDPPGFAELTRQERAAIFTRDPLVRRVGDFMTRLSSDLNYARIYMNNLSHDTLTSSQWAESFNIVGEIYSGRGYLVDALRDGKGQMFGIARLNQVPSYFVASRIDDADGLPLGSVTVRFDAPDMAHYLTGRHIALIVNREGRVTTSSSAPFILRNVAALLPPDTLRPSDSDEGSGKPMDIRAVAGSGNPDQWLIDGHPYLLRRQPLTDAQYQLLTLAAFDHLAHMRRQHFWAAGLVAALGLALILLSGLAAGQMMMRRQEERYAANYDALTGLPNRRAILAEVERLFALAKRTQQSVLVAFIDLDGFKAINDSYGHGIGDKFLVEVSRRLSAGLRSGDVLGRWGGDEFVVIGLAAPSRPGEPDQTADVMRSRLAPLLIGTHILAGRVFDYPGASFGIACVDPSVSSLQSALMLADKLMYADKRARRGQQPSFRSDMALTSSQTGIERR